MAIKLYLDDEMTVEVGRPQKLTQAEATDPGTFKVYELSLLTGADLNSVYHYDAPNDLYTKLVVDVDYTVVDDTITLANSLVSGNFIIAVPINKVDLNFGGVPGSSKTSTAFIILKRDAGFVYDNLRIHSEDIDKPAVYLSDSMLSIISSPDASLPDAEGNTVTGSMLQGFNIAFTVNELIGCAVMLNGIYIGKAIANDDSSILIDNDSFYYSSENNDDVIEIFSVGSLLFAPESDGQAPIAQDFQPVMPLPTLTIGRDTCKVFIRGTEVIPDQAINLPDHVYRLSGVEYTE